MATRGSPARAGAATADAVRLLVAAPDEPTGPPWRGTTGLAVWVGLVTVFGVDAAQLAAGMPQNSALVGLLALAHTGAVAVALRFPLMGWRLSLLATALTPIVISGVGQPWAGSTLFLHLVTLFLLALAARGRVTAAAAAVDVVGGAAWIMAAGAPALPTALSTLFTVALVAGLGVAIRAQRGTARSLVAARRGTAEEQARRAVLEERARIAREMHDVVAHHLSAIAVRAESAPHRIPHAVPGAAAEFGTIAGAARDALADMRRLIGVLRAGDPDRPSAPVPDLDGLGALVETLRGSGMDVELAATGAPRAVSGEVGLAGYRVVQEALSNAARHATGAAVTVRVHWLPAAVRLQVDSGTGAKGDAPGELDGAGTGLLGMRERVTAVGGLLVAGPRPGGYTVDATLPTGAG